MDHRQRWPDNATPGLAAYRLKALRGEDRPEPKPKRNAQTGPTCSRGVRIAADGTCCGEHAEGARDDVA